MIFLILRELLEKVEIHMGTSTGCFNKREENQKDNTKSIRLQTAFLHPQSLFVFNHK